MKINFNEGSKFGSWIPFVLAINLDALWLYLAVGLPYPCRGRDPARDSDEKFWHVRWKPLFRIVWKKDKP